MSTDQYGVLYLALIKAVLLSNVSDRHGKRSFDVSEPVLKRAEGFLLEPCYAYS